MMTVANQITVFRILLIPVFVLFALYYGASVSRGAPQEWLRFTAIGVFVFASVTDAFDGWVARRLGQVSQFGTILDPIADKGLLLTAIVTLSFSPWSYSLPIWFAVLVIARDVVIVVGCVVVQIFGENLVVKPTLIGKTATALQMVAVAGVMLQIPYFEPAVWAAGAFTLASGLGYLFQGVAQLAHLDYSGRKP